MLFLVWFWVVVVFFFFFLSDVGWGSVTDREALLPVILVASGDTSDFVRPISFFPN